MDEVWLTFFFIKEACVEQRVISAPCRASSVPSVNVVPVCVALSFIVAKHQRVRTVFPELKGDTFEKLPFPGALVSLFLFALWHSPQSPLCFAKESGFEHVAFQVSPSTVICFLSSSALSTLSAAKMGFCALDELETKSHSG